jgi:hypothetical protein
MHYMVLGGDPGAVTDVITVPVDATKCLIRTPRVVQVLVPQ